VSFKKRIISERIVHPPEMLQNVSAYIFTTTMDIQYDGKVHVFTNFSCQHVQNSNLSTFVATYPDGDEKQVMILSLQNSKPKGCKKFQNLSNCETRFSKLTNCLSWN